MERWAAKLLALFVMFGVIFASMLAPIKVSKVFARLGHRGDIIVSYMMCFGGGVFLSAYTLFMAPEARDIINESFVEPYGIEYPASDFIMVCGFLAMLLLDMTVHRHSMRQQRPESCKDRPNGDKVDSREKDSTMNGNDALIEVQNTCSPGVRRQGRLEEPLGDRNGATVEKSHQLSTSTSGQGVDCHGPVTDVSTAVKGSKPYHVDIQDPSVKYLLKDGKLMTNHELEADQHQKYRNEDAILHLSDHFAICPEERCRNSRSLILLLALSLDHVFEGLSIGLKRNEADVWSLCIAIIAHEVIIAFSLGMQMVMTYKKTRQVVIAAAVCSAMAPIGVIIGMSVTETGHQQSQMMLLINGILQSLATGVFIYVTFFEILQRELGSEEEFPSYVKFFFVVAGFGCLALIALIPDSSSAMSHVNDAGAAIMETSTAVNLTESIHS